MSWSKNYETVEAFKKDEGTVSGTVIDGDLIVGRDAALVILDSGILGNIDCAVFVGGHRNSDNKYSNINISVTGRG